jgi:polysaccharide export outer membrane protein
MHMFEIKKMLKSMKLANIFCYVCFFFAIIVSLHSSCAQESSGGRACDITYSIGKGDTLEISVWGNPELTKTVTVRPDGNISLPLIDQEIKADGIKPSQLKDTLSVLYSKEIKNPKVSVIVTGFASKRIWVLGEVVTPGVYPFSGEVDVLQAIIQAGGYKNSAHLENVVVIRNVTSAKPDFYMINLANHINGKKSSAINLAPGDVVYLPRSVIAHIDSFIKFFTDKVAPTYVFGKGRY